MSTIQPTDVLLVNRAGVDHSIVKTAVMATVQDTDLLLVNRAGVDYQATYADVKKGFGPQQITPAPGDWTFAPAIAGGTGTQADPFIITPETVNVPGGTVQSAQTLTLTGLTPNDLVEWTDHSAGAGNRFHQLLALVPPSGQVDLRLNYLDTPNSTVGAPYTGDLQIGTSYFRWVVTQNVAVAPVIGTVTLADSPEAGRFSSGTFATTVTMTEDGIPASTKGLKAWVEGSLKQAAMSSAITNVAGNVLTLTDTTGLADFAAGDAVTEVGNGNDATGTVGAVDATANTITLSASAGTWDVGSQVKGPLKTVNKQPNSDEIVAVNASPVYSRNLTSPSGWSGIKTAEKAFNGTPFTNFDDVAQASAINDTLTYAATDPIFASVTTLTLWIFQNNPGETPIVTINGSGAAGANTQSPATPYGLYEYEYTVGGAVTAFTVQSNNSSVSTRLGAVFVDGVRLIDGATTLTFASDKELTDFASGDAVNQDDSAASGTVGSVDVTAKTMTLSASTGSWAANAGKYVIGPTKPASNVKLYTVHDAAGAVSDLQSADPGYVTMTGNSPYTLTFPATLPTGNAPDVDLPAGTTLTTEIQATSTGSTAVTKTSNTITPA